MDCARTFSLGFLAPGLENDPALMEAQIITRGAGRIPHFDVTAALENTGDEACFLTELLELFLNEEDYPKRLRIAIYNYVNNNTAAALSRPAGGSTDHHWEAVRREVIGIRDCANILGAVPLAEACQAFLQLEHFDTYNFEDSLQTIFVRYRAFELEAREFIKKHTAGDPL
eukprot:GEZU01018249.1.p1 GENE.GEZU01018249.1~~GEZU01018249.1.p1  ORF type:complete len:171 (-),score=26.24 GEZU01018249.1:37-549(-)